MAIGDKYRVRLTAEQYANAELCRGAVCEARERLASVAVMLEMIGPLHRQAAMVRESVRALEHVQISIFDRMEEVAPLAGEPSSPEPKRGL